MTPFKLYRGAGKKHYHNSRTGFAADFTSNSLLFKVASKQILWKFLNIYILLYVFIKKSSEKWKWLFYLPIEPWWIKARKYVSQNWHIPKNFMIVAIWCDTSQNFMSSWRKCDNLYVVFSETEFKCSIEKCICRVFKPCLFSDLRKATPYALNFCTPLIKVRALK